MTSGRVAAQVGKWGCWRRLSGGGGWWALVAGGVSAIARGRDWQRGSVAKSAWFQSDHLDKRVNQAEGDWFICGSV